MKVFKSAASLDRKTPVIGRSREIITARRRRQGVRRSHRHGPDGHEGSGGKVSRRMRTTSPRRVTFRWTKFDITKTTLLVWIKERPPAERTDWAGSTHANIEARWAARPTNRLPRVIPAPARRGHPVRLSRSGRVAAICRTDRDSNLNGFAGVPCRRPTSTELFNAFDSAQQDLEFFAVFRDGAARETDPVLLAQLLDDLLIGVGREWSRRR